MHLLSRSTPYTAPTLAGAFCILAIMMGTLVSACDSSGSSSSDSPDVLIPLVEGNQWTAEATDERGDLEPRTGTLSVEITGSEQASVTFADVSGTVEVKRQGDGGVVIDLSEYYEGEGYYEGGIMFMKYPVEEGDSYQFTNTEDRQYRIDVLRESISVPAGSYDCILYEIVEGPPDEVGQRIWVKPGVGPVKYMSTDIMAELTSTNVEE